MALALVASALLLTEKAGLPTIQLPAGGTASGVYFEPNLGQADPSINFIGTGAGFKLFLEDGQLRASQGGAAGAGTVDIRFRGSSPDPVVTGSGGLPGVSHYYLGNDPANWIENVPHYGEVTYEGIYPGIDLVFHSRLGNPEYDFIVHPGVDPSVVRLDIAGTSAVTLTDNGSLRLEAADAEPIIMAPPVIYQGTRTNVIPGSYAFLTDGTIGFSIGDYDESKPLVIDPELVFSTYVGGEGFDFVSQGRGADATGAYTCFWSSSNTLPGVGSIRTPPRSDLDTVCTKHSASGQLLYATVLGGTADDLLLDYTSDSQGRLHGIGEGESMDYPVTPDAFQPTAQGGFTEAFMFTLDPNGQKAFASYMGGSVFSDDGHAVFADEDGSLYLGGGTTSPDFMATTGAVINRLTPYGGAACANDVLDCFDNFLVKLNPENEVEFVTLFGGSAGEIVLSIAVGSDGAIHLTGNTRSSDLLTTPGAYQDNYGGILDGFVSKLDPTGSTILYLSYLGGTELDNPFEGGSLDASGNLYLTGTTESANFPVTPDAFQPGFGGVSDAFVVKFRPDGNGEDDLVYSSFVGGSGIDAAPNIELDQFGNAYITGGTDSPNFPVTPDAFQGSGPGFQNAFLTVLNPSLPPAEQLLYSTYLGGSVAQFGSGLGADLLGNVYVHGPTASPDFPVLNAAQPFLADVGIADNFVAKFHIWDEVGIDIKPGNARNNINPKSNGVFDLAILSSASFYAPTNVDPSTIRLEGAGVSYLGNGEANCKTKDVNKDRIVDLVCKIETSQLKLRPGTPVANLVARTFGGDILMGQDAIQLR